MSNNEDLKSISQGLLTKIIHSTYLGTKGLNFFLEIFDLISFLKVDYIIIRYFLQSMQTLNTNFLLKKNNQ